MMHYVRIARANLDGTEVALRMKRQRNRKAAIQVRTFGGYLERRRHLRFQIGRAQGPAFGEVRCGRGFGGVSFLSALFGPVLENSNVRLAQATLAGEVRS